MTQTIMNKVTKWQLHNHQKIDIKCKGTGEFYLFTIKNKQKLDIVWWWCRCHRRNPLVPRGCVSALHNHLVGKIQRHNTKTWTWYVFRLFPTNHPTRNHRLYRVSCNLPTVPVHCFQPIKLQVKAVSQSQSSKYLLSCFWRMSVFGALFQLFESLAICCLV